MFPPGTSQSCTYTVLGLPTCVTRQLFPLASVGPLQCHPQKPFANLSFCSGLAPGSLAKKDASMANTIQRTESPILAFAHSPSLGARTEDVRLPSTLKLNEDSRGTPQLFCHRRHLTTCANANPMTFHVIESNTGWANRAWKKMSSRSQAPTSWVLGLASGQMVETHTGILKTEPDSRLPSPSLTLPHLLGSHLLQSPPQRRLGCGIFLNYVKMCYLC